MRTTLQTLSTVLVSIALASGCVVINMPPDDAGSTTSPEGDGTTESTGNETTDEVSTDETETSTPYDLPSETESGTTSDTTDTDDTVDETSGDVSLCCTCPDPITREYQCWDWDWSTEAVCVEDQPATIGKPTVWCISDDGFPADCLAQCG
jgi:hypothetical protein